PASQVDQASGGKPTSLDHFREPCKRDGDMKALTGPSSPAGRSSLRRAGGTSGPGREATIYQVADRAGVSIATVSRVLRGTAPVAEATRVRVLSAVDELRFTPSRSARS